MISSKEFIQIMHDISKENIFIPYLIVKKENDKWSVSAFSSTPKPDDYKNSIVQYYKDIVFNVDIFGNYSVTSGNMTYISCTGESSYIGNYDLLFICVSENGDLNFNGINYRVHLPVYPRITEKSSYSCIIL